MRDVEADGYTIHLDLSGQVLGISAPEHRDYVDDGESQGSAEAPIQKTLAEARDGRFVSAAVLAAKAKAFDDGLYAAVELAADGFKARLLEALAKALAESAAEPAVAVVLAGAAIGGRHSEFAPPVNALIKNFMVNELRSKPLGFYTWSDTLGRIFRRDRMLQSELKGRAGIEAVVKALAADDGSAQDYRRALVLAERLTNSLASRDLRPLVAAAKAGRLEGPENGVAFFPASRAPETDLVDELYGNRSIPDGFDLAAEMLSRIRGGKLSLAPGEGDGWYAHVLYSLEPLAAPEKVVEAKHLVLDEEYRKMLAELFKGLLTLTRETHVKQLVIPYPGAALAPVVLRVTPCLRTEPLATHYFRRASSYGFVREVLTETFGVKPLTAMHRVTATGAVEANLDAELAAMESLFRGASAVVMGDLGLEPLRAEGAAADERAFDSFASAMKDDPDVGGDMRCMVPVFYDRERKKTKVWVFLGWAERPIEVSYVKEPKVVSVVDPAGRPAKEHPEIRFKKYCHRVLYPVMAEVYVTKLLDRKEFREHCDRYGSRKKILAALE